MADSQGVLMDARREPCSIVFCQCGSQRVKALNEWSIACLDCGRRSELTGFKLGLAMLMPGDLRLARQVASDDKSWPKTS